jgi:hypothetical protein
MLNLYGLMVIVNNAISSDKKIHIDEHCIRTFVQTSQWTLVISLSIINHLVLIICTDLVLCEGRTKVLCYLDKKTVLQKLLLLQTNYKFTLFPGVFTCATTNVRFIQ